MTARHTNTRIRIYIYNNIYIIYNNNNIIIIINNIIIYIYIIYNKDIYQSVKYQNNIKKNSNLPGFEPGIF